MKKFMVCLAVLCLVCAGASAQVSTALSGAVTFGGREDARFILPLGLVQDAEGKILVLDGGNNIVFRLTEGESPVILLGAIKEMETLVYDAGGYADDALLLSRFRNPCDALIDARGRLVIVDSGNHVLRVQVGEEMYTLSGCGEAGYQSGDKKTTKYDSPSGIASLDGETFYVADALNHCIRRVSITGESALYAGKAGEAGCADGALADALFNEPGALCFGPDGALYVSDSGNQRIRKIVDGVVTTVAGGGEYDEETGYYAPGFADGEDARFNFPAGVCFAENILLIADAGNNVIRALLPSGAVVTVAGSGEAGYLDGDDLSAQFNRPTDVLYVDGTVYVSDSLNRAVRTVTFAPGVYE